MKYHYGIHVIIIISTQQVTGGLFLRPIPGHMLQTVETTPQVSINVAMVCKVCKPLPSADPC